MLGKVESLFLISKLDSAGNTNYERVLPCRIKKKVERWVSELEEVVPLLSFKPERWAEDYGITVMRKSNCLTYLKKDNLQKGGFRTT